MENNTHAPRLDMQAATPKVYAAMAGFQKATQESDLDAGLRELIVVRASQINGCAFCLDMHIREARSLGIPDHRLHLLCVWREAPGFSEAERAALELTEAVTRIADGGVPDALYEKVRRHYSEEQYVGLLTTINAINAWNRFMIALGAVPPQR